MILHKNLRDIKEKASLATCYLTFQLEFKLLINTGSNGPYFLVWCGIKGWPIKKVEYICRYENRQLTNKKEQNSNNVRNFTIPNK